MFFLDIDVDEKFSSCRYSLLMKLKLLMFITLLIDKAVFILHEKVNSINFSLSLSLTGKVYPMQY